MPISETVFADGTAPQVPYSQLRENVRNGDLLLCSGSATFSKLIQHATNSIWSHVGFLMWLEPLHRLMVVESVESIGVRTVPLSSYLSDYSGTGNHYPGNVLIACHETLHAQHLGPRMPSFATFAIDRFGYPYDTDEIIRIAARIASGGLLEGGNLQDIKEYICSEYVDACYRTLGVEIRRASPGFISPADFARDPDVNAVAIPQAA